MNKTQLLSPLLNIESTMAFKLSELKGPSAKLLESLLKKKFDLGTKTQRPFYWNAEAYGLDKTTLFQSCTEEQKFLILKGLNDLRFMEALSIEKAGIHYHSKMVLLSDSLDEKTFYSAFVADELRHFHSFLQYCPIETPVEYLQQNPFLQLINLAIQDGDRECMMAFLQHILEGLGLSYYRSLKETCNDESLKADLEALLKDEAFHVGSANVFLDNKVYDDQKPLLKELIFKFAEGHPAWIYPVISACDQVLGGLSKTQKAQLLTELNYEQINAQKTLELKNLIMCPFTKPIVDEAEKRNLFSAITVSQFVERF
ncbi:ferritin-like domain-containing protein [Bdellovibrio sp. HCB337]|uniref:ferritin-like domain-containing protein n=1 Tax=Bdellovibrio sp. HCB337 TaxID=3394358 RepID=UPI0039A58307